MEQEGNRRPPTSMKINKGLSSTGRPEARSDRLWHRPARRRPAPGPVSTGRCKVSSGASSSLSRVRPVTRPVGSGAGPGAPAPTGPHVGASRGMSSMSQSSSGHGPAPTECGRMCGSNSRWASTMASHALRTQREAARSRGRRPRMLASTSSGKVCV